MPLLRSALGYSSRVITGYLSEEQLEDGITTGAINPKIQRKYVKKLRGITTAAAESKPSAYALLKRRAIEQEREIEQLKAKLASLQRGGSLFDLKKDKAKDIGDVIANTAIESKALAISGAIKAKKGTRTEAI